MAKHHSLRVSHYFTACVSDTSAHTMTMQAMAMPPHAVHHACNASPHQHQAQQSLPPPGWCRVPAQANVDYINPVAGAGGFGCTQHSPAWRAAQSVPAAVGMPAPAPHAHAHQQHVPAGWRQENQFATRPEYPPQGPLISNQSAGESSGSCGSRSVGGTEHHPEQGRRQLLPARSAAPQQNAGNRTGVAHNSSASAPAELAGSGAPFLPIPEAGSFETGLEEIIYKMGEAQVTPRPPFHQARPRTAAARPSRDSGAAAPSAI